MPGDAIIGKVAVKVIPDTKNFKREAEAALKKIESSLQDMKVQLVPELDGTKVKEQAKALRRQVQTEMKDINISVNLDNQESVKAALARLKAELTRLGEVQIPVGLNSADVKAGIALLEEQLNKIADIHLKVDTGDMASVKAAIAQVDRELQKLREVDIAVKLNEGDLNAAKALMEGELKKLQAKAQIDIDTKLRENLAQSQKVMDGIKARLNSIEWAPGIDDAKLAKLKADVEATLIEIAGKKAKLSLELDPLARRKIMLEIDALEREIGAKTATIAPEIDQKRSALVSASLAVLTRARDVDIRPVLNSSFTRRIGKAIEQLSGFLVIRAKLEAIGEILGSFDKYAPKIAAVGLGIVGIAGAALSASGNLFALASSLASIGLAGVALPGILGGLAVGLGASFIALKDFKKEVPQITSLWKEMKSTISDNFWATARKPMSDMVNTLMPQFTAQLKTTSGVLGGFFGSLATNISNALGPRLSGMFAALNSSITIATGSTGGLANIIGVLGSLGASYLPRLAQWFTDIVNKLSEFLTKAQNDGTLQKWVETGITALKGLWSVLTGIVDILHGIATAATAAGGASLNSLGSALHGIADVINSPAFQTGLTQLFGAAFAAMQQIATIAGPAVQQALLQIGNLLTAILPLAGTAIGTLLNDIGTALTNPLITQGITVLFAQIVTAVQALTPIWFPLASAIGLVAPLVGQLVQVMATLVAGLANTLFPVVSALTPLISQLITVLGGALIQAFTSLEPVVIQVVNAFASFVSSGLIPAITAAVNALLPVFLQLAPILGGVIVQAFNALAPILPVIASAFATLVTALAPLVGQILNALASLLPLIATAFIGILQAVIPLLAPLIQLVQSILTPLIGVVQSLAAEFLPKFMQAFQNLASALAPLIAALQNLWNIIGPVLIPVVQFLAQLFLDSVLGAINGVINVVKGVILVFQGVIDFVKGVFTGNWGEAWNGIKEIFSGVLDAIIGVFEVWWNVGILGTFKKGYEIIKGLWELGWNAIKGFIPGILDEISGFFTGFFSRAGSVISGGLGSIKQFFVDGFNAVKGFVSDAMGAIKNAIVGAFNYMLDAFENFPGNLIRLGQKIWDFFKEIPGKILSAFGNVGSLLTDVGKSIIQGLINGIENMFGKVKDMLGKLTSWLPDWKGPATRDKTLLTDAGQLVIQSFIDGLESKYDAVKQSLSGLTGDISGMDMGTLSAPGVSVSGTVSALAAGAFAGGAGGGSSKTLNYYAAPGSSISSEEDLFKAANRARMGW